MRSGIAPIACVSWSLSAPFLRSWGTISEEITNTKDFLVEIKKCFKKSDKVERSTLLQNLISMKYQSKWNIREYIMSMSNIVSKLKALKIEFSEDFLVHLVLFSLPS
jgi:hypothetical protein